MDILTEVVGDIGNLLEKFPSLAIWVLAGILFYKTIIIGSVFGLLRLLILRGYDAFMKPKVITTKHKIAGYFVGDESDAVHLVSIIKGCRRDSTGSYIHHSDIRFVEQAIKEKKERESKK